MEFRTIQPEHLEMILNWRTKPEVTRYMFTDVEHDMEKQKAWYETLSSDNSRRQWLILYKDAPIGVVALNAIDWKKKHAYTGYYIGELKYSIAGPLVLPFLYNFAFFELNFDNLYADVMEGNENMMKFHKVHGFIYIATKKNLISKYGKMHDVLSFVLTRDSWLSRQDKFGKYKAEFPSYENVG